MWHFLIAIGVAGAFFAAGICVGIIWTSFHD
jgi:hypothetical protein